MRPPPRTRRRDAVRAPERNHPRAANADAPTVGIASAQTTAARCAISIAARPPRARRYYVISRRRAPPRMHAHRAQRLEPGQRRARRNNAVKSLFRSGMMS
ncbi:hypothetical protein GPA09_12600 [Burkholderia pseudomallei]|nr:hypothetical protein [Burkholderia pseudomallei]